MRAEFFRPDDRDRVVGVARWDGRGVAIEADDPAVSESLARVFRSAPVAVDDGALRPAGAHGKAVLEPGSLEWFRAAAFTRAAEAGLAARLVPEASGGWDPAAAYRTFRESVSRIVSPPS